MFHSKTARLNNFTRPAVAGALIALPLVAFAPIASARIPADPDAGPEIMFAENGVDPNGLPIALDAPGNAQGNDLALQQEPNELGLEQLEEPVPPSPLALDDEDLALPGPEIDIPREVWIQGIEDVLVSPPPLSPLPMDDQIVADLMAAVDAPDIQPTGD
ncbi:hypothetical protein [Mycobacterium decipiens]|uniref:Resuscitation-promoting factor RpfA n=1 Tax=Mycobacterium decipiens TaxID=1430326 RepID=A0A1X2LWG4_9MYCO|nr:hypothetical protein [Mycobacterium decipiens]OSC41500.1 hypothetical protein B8W66_09025 [Mycobacterium decipiens]